MTVASWSISKNSFCAVLVRSTGSLYGAITHIVEFCVKENLAKATAEAK